MNRSRFTQGLSTQEPILVNAAYYIIFGDKSEVDDRGNFRKYKSVTYQYRNNVENEIKGNSRRPIINLQWPLNGWYQLPN